MSPSMSPLSINIAEDPPAPRQEDGAGDQTRGHPPRPHVTRERRATARAGADWHQARGREATPSLIHLCIGDSKGAWHDRFLIRSDEHMPHAVFITCGETLQSDWAMPRLGGTLQDDLPMGLQDRFTAGCQRSLAETVNPSPWKAATGTRTGGRCCFAAS